MSKEKLVTFGQIKSALRSKYESPQATTVESASIGGGVYVFRGDTVEVPTQQGTRTGMIVKIVRDDLNDIKHGYASTSLVLATGDHTTRLISQFAISSTIKILARGRRNKQSWTGRSERFLPEFR